MNDNTGMEANLLRQFPMALQADKQMQVMAAVIAKALTMRWGEAELGILYNAIDRLPEQVLDILAYDFKVDWYEYGYSIEEKRQTLREAWKVHRIKGTKAAVETAIRAIYPLTTVEEWFEYGGEPYHFRLNINITDDTINSDKQRRVMERMRFYKNLRSHLDKVKYFLMPEKSWAVAGGGLVGSVERITVKLNEGRVSVPTGRAATGGAAGVLHSYQRIWVPIRNPVENVSGR